MEKDVIWMPVHRLVGRWHAAEGLQRLTNGDAKKGRRGRAAARRPRASKLSCPAQALWQPRCTRAVCLAAALRLGRGSGPPRSAGVVNGPRLLTARRPPPLSGSGG